MRVLWSELKTFVSSRALSVQYVDTADKYSLAAFDGLFTLECELPKSPSDTTDLDDFVNNFKAAGNKSPSTNTALVDPFAKPIYRTKRNRTASLLTIAKNTSQTSDFLLTAERYTAGGRLLVENAELGDTVTASVYDVDSAIPAPYRAALCEAWPLVASYIEDEWVNVGVPGSITAGSISTVEIMTAPLAAKITAGLYLRLTYNAVNSGLDRRLGVNYYLYKKL